MKYETAFICSKGQKDSPLPNKVDYPMNIA